MGLALKIYTINPQAKHLVYWLDYRIKVNKKHLFKFNEVPLICGGLHFVTFTDRDYIYCAGSCNRTYFSNHTEQ